jgi:hypothetical protein
MTCAGAPPGLGQFGIATWRGGNQICDIIAYLNASTGLRCSRTVWNRKHVEVPLQTSAHFAIRALATFIHEQFITRQILINGN